MAEEVYREWFVRLRFPGYENVPLDREQGIPKGWEKKPCPSVMKIMSGGTPKTGVPIYWDGEIPFFTPGDVEETYYVNSTRKTLTEKGVLACSSALFPKDTIFITARGTVGKLALAGKPMAMNQTCYALAPIDSHNEAYFYFLALKDSTVV